MIIKTLIAAVLISAPMGAFAQTSVYPNDAARGATRSGESVTVAPDSGRGSSEYYRGGSRGEQTPTQGSQAPSNDAYGPSHGPSAGSQEQ